MQINIQEQLNILKQRSLDSPKIDYEFQELGLELQELLGVENKGGTWSIFYEKGMTEDRVRRAIKEFKKRRLGYFKWILKEIIK